MGWHAWYAYARIRRLGSLARPGKTSRSTSSNARRPAQLTAQLRSLAKEHRSRIETIWPEHQFEIRLIETDEESRREDIHVGLEEAG